MKTSYTNFGTGTVYDIEESLTQIKVQNVCIRKSVTWVYLGNTIVRSSRLPYSTPNNIFSIATKERKLEARKNYRNRNISSSN